MAAPLDESMNLQEAFSHYASTDNFEYESFQIESGCLSLQRPSESQNDISN